MKAVKVTYSVKPEYVEENKKNIRKVMDALKANPIKGMLYSSFTDDENPNTFIHINMATDDNVMRKINGIQEFKDFQQALKTSRPISPPKATKLKLVGAGFNL
jgi:quinol monooxygenase YgiN